MKRARINYPCPRCGVGHMLFAGRGFTHNCDCCGETRTLDAKYPIIATVSEQEETPKLLPNNLKRAKRAAKTLKEYGYPIEDECAVTDILTDLRHLCDRDGYDFGNLLRISENHYAEEAGHEP